jgi:hypothetical protein
MTGKAFINAVTNGRGDILGWFLNLLGQVGADYCVIGGLAVNAYVEPVVSLDLDIVVVASSVGALAEAARADGARVEEFAHSVNLSVEGSDLRIQVQTDPRYQDFISRAQTRTVLGYEMKVAALEDVLQGKLWAYQDTARRKSKRQKDLADITRLVEAYPALLGLLPDEVRSAAQ